MRYSKLFGQTIKQVSGKIESKSHEFLTKAGFINQVAAGIYTWLPLGKRVLDKVDHIIREEMNVIGGQEVFMPVLHPKKNWLKTGRWDSLDILFKIKSQHGHDYAVGPTHEEIITPLVANYLSSYKDLPIFLYQIQTKFRDEPRAKSGVIRGREFGMKDMYSFHATHDDLEKFYQIVTQAYLKIFRRCGLDVKVTEASGGTFTKKYSHEFLVISGAGEDTIIYCPVCKFAQNKEISKFKAGDICPKCGKELAADKAIEAGNIFDLGTKFSQDFNLFYTDKNGKQKPVYMGCYGIGDTRLVGAIAEVHNDQLGLIWPESVAPYKVHLVSIHAKKREVEVEVKHPKKTAKNPEQTAEEIYKKLTDQNIEVLYDDRQNVSAGQKLVDADLIGCPQRWVVSEKTLAQGGVEVKDRKSQKTQILPIEKALDKSLIN